MSADLKVEVPAAAATAAEPAKAGLEATAPDVFAAIASFIRTNSHIESSACIDSVTDELKSVADLQAAFDVPIRYAILSLDDTLRWAYFLAIAAKRCDPALPFSVDAAFDLAADVYDIGTREIVDTHFDDGDSSESSSDED